METRQLFSKPKAPMNLVIPLAVLVCTTRLAAGGPGPGLDELIRSALANNLDLQGARLAPESARGDLGQAEGRFDPQLTLGPEVNRNNEVLINSLSVAGQGVFGYDKYGLSLAGATPWSTQYRLDAQAMRRTESRVLLGGAPADPLQYQAYPTEWDSSVQLGLTQPLLRGFGATLAGAPVARARLVLTAAEARARQQADQLVASVEQGYAALELAAWQERAGAASLERTLKLYQRNQERQALGLIAQVDLLAVDRAVQNRRAGLAAARQARQEAEASLRSLVFGAKAADAEPVRVAEDPPAAVPVPDLPGLAECERRAVDQRHNLAASREDLEALRLDLQVARDGLRPSLTFTGAYTIKGARNEADRLTAGGRPNDQGIRGWTVGLSLGVPLFNRAARGAAQKAAVQVRQQELTLQSLEQDIRTSVRTAYAAIGSARERLGFAEQAEDLGRRHYDAEVERLELGLSDVFRVTQVEEELAAAEVATAQARSDLIKAVSIFQFAMGASAQPYL